MKVLLINGSPHREGCTYTALSEIVGALHSEGIETEIFQIGTQPVQGCTGCRTCSNSSGWCVLDGDLCNELIAKMQEADGIVIGSPVYFAGPNGALCALLDRAFFARRSYEGKPAAAVVSCRRGGSTAALDRLNKYFAICQMPVVSSQYWNMVHGNTPDQVRQDEEGLQIMRTLGRNMAWMLRCAEKAGIPFPEPEPKITTNFIR